MILLPDLGDKYRSFNILFHQLVLITRDPPLIRDFGDKYRSFNILFHQFVLITRDLPSDVASVQNLLGAEILVGRD